VKLKKRGKKGAYSSSFLSSAPVGEEGVQSPEKGEEDERDFVFAIGEKGGAVHAYALLEESRR